LADLHSLLYGDRGGSVFTCLRFQIASYGLGLKMPSCPAPFSRLWFCIITSLRFLVCVCSLSAFFFAGFDPEVLRCGVRFFQLSSPESSWVDCFFFCSCLSSVPFAGSFFLVVLCFSRVEGLGFFLVVGLTPPTFEKCWRLVSLSGRVCTGHWVREYSSLLSRFPHLLVLAAP